MTRRLQSLVTHNGMTRSQPGTSVSYSDPAYDTDFTPIPGKVRLSVRRYYPDLPNSFGGRGVSKPLDCDGMLFNSADEAIAFALERGYLQTHRSRTLHEQHVELERKYPGYFYGQRLKARALFNSKEGN